MLTSIVGNGSTLLLVLFGFGVFGALGYAASMIPNAILKGFAYFVLVLVCAGWCMGVIPAIPLPSPISLFK
jgi:hypothetical protein